MIIDENLLKRLEKLSCLQLSDENRANLVNDFSDILNFVEHLNEIDTANEEILSNNFTPLREDIVKKSTVVECILDNAPARNKNFFSVPKIIE